VSIAGVIGWQLWIYYLEAPWTRDGRVRADVVQIAADVSGLVRDVSVHDNQTVKKGEVLFRIDPARFEIALRDAQANVDSKLAAAQEAQRETERYNRLNALSVSEEQQQQRSSAATEAQAAYQQALANRDVAALNLARSEVHAPVNALDHVPAGVRLVTGRTTTVVVQVPVQTAQPTNGASSRPPRGAGG
jgi:multidrug resistance efflux pump